MLAFGYNTNGFANHDLLDAIGIVADLGYDGIALTLDVHHLNPLRVSAREVSRIAGALCGRGLRVVVETGARYILDPWRKHEPTLLDPDPSKREARFGYLAAAIEVASDLGAEAVALFSGPLPEGVPADVAYDRLAQQLGRLAEVAVRAKATLAFEPEPGHLVETLADYDRLCGLAGEALRLTLDIGHVRCSEGIPIETAIGRYAARIANVHMEDIRGRTHEHLPFGEGEIDFPPILDALERAHYSGLVTVELSRHSHDAPVQARRSIEFLRRIVEDARRR
jgi:sugar phosphate isomerase/epimerase